MHLKIRTKIIASTMLVVTVSLLLSGFLTYDYATGIIREQSIKDSKTKLAQISFQLKKVQDQIIKTAEYIVSDEEIRSLVYQPASEQFEENYFRKQTVQEKLKRFTALNDLILNALIVRPDGETFSNNSGYEDYFATYLQEPWFKALRQAKSGFSQPHPFFSLGGNRQAFTYVLKYRPIGMKASQDSYLLLDIAYSEIDNAFVQSAGDFARIELLTGDGNLLYQSADHPSVSEIAFMKETFASGKEEIEDRKHIALVNDTMSLGWRQVALLSKAQLFAKIDHIAYYYVAVLGLGFLFSLMIMLPLILNMTKPLSRLTNAMKRVSVGDLQTSVSIRSKDELEILGAGFNRMVSELKSNIEHSLRNEQIKRNMHIDLLIAQINPHFIYNTLNTIIYLCHAERNRQAIEMTQSLIAILQDTVRTGDGAMFATLVEEQRIIDKYCAIQQTRYPGQFELRWRIEDGLEQAVVPRMMLQPIVENAILHGLFPADKEDGIIEIRARMGHHHLLLEVEDNGVGIHGDMKENDNENAMSLDHNRTRGIGIANIRERIHYHYGDAYGVEIEDAVEQGTLVTLRLPLQYSHDE